MPHDRRLRNPRNRSNRLPPLPRSFGRDRRVERELGARTRLAQEQREQVLPDRPTSTNSLEDALLQLQNTRPDDKQAREVALQAVQQQPNSQEEGGFLSSLLGVLEKVALPFEAFAEGVNAIIGPAVPQEAFQERSSRSRDILGRLFSFDISGAEAAGLLREVHRERSTVEQLITGFAFDPLNILWPGGSMVRAGLKGATKGQIVRVGGTSFVDFTLPFIGPRILRKLSPNGAAALIRETTENIAEPLAKREPIGRMNIEGGAVDEAGDYGELLKSNDAEWVRPKKDPIKPKGTRPRDKGIPTYVNKVMRGKLAKHGLTKEQIDKLEPAEAQKILEPEEGVPTAPGEKKRPRGRPIKLSGMLDPVEGLDALEVAADELAPQYGTLIRLMRATAAREFETILVEYVDFETKRISFFDKTSTLRRMKDGKATMGRVRQSVRLTDRMLEELRHLMEGKKPNQALFTSPDGKPLFSTQLNDLVAQLGKTAGFEEVLRGGDIRAAAATALYNRLAGLGFSADAVAQMLGHGPDVATRLRNGYIAKGMQVPNDLEWLNDVLSFSDDPFKPPVVTPLNRTEPETGLQGRRVGILQRLLGGKKQAINVGERGSLKGKVEIPTTKAVKKLLENATEPPKIFAALEVAGDWPGLLAKARDQELFSEAEYRFLEDIFRMQTASHKLGTAQLADEFMSARQYALSYEHIPEAKGWGSARKGLEREMNLLALGVTSAIQDHIDLIAEYPRLVGLLVKADLLPDAAAVAYLELIPKWIKESYDQLEGTKVRFIQRHVDIGKDVRRLELDPTSLREKQGIRDILPPVFQVDGRELRLEDLSQDEALQVAKDWMETPGIRGLLGALGIRQGKSGDGQLETTTSKLANILIRLTQKVASRHLLGNDFYAAPGKKIGDLFEPLSVPTDPVASLKNELFNDFPGNRIEVSLSGKAGEELQGTMYVAGGEPQTQEDLMKFGFRKTAPLPSETIEGVAAKLKSQGYEVVNPEGAGDVFRKGNVNLTLRTEVERQFDRMVRLLPSAAEAVKEARRRPVGKIIGDMLAPEVAVREARATRLAGLLDTLGYISNSEVSQIRAERLMEPGAVTGLRGAGKIPGGGGITPDPESTFNATRVGRGASPIVRTSERILNFAGRDIIQVELPDGTIQPFYRRTGKGGGGEALEGGAGKWVPFDGIQVEARWFDKTKYVQGSARRVGDPLYRAGTKYMRDIGHELDARNIPKRMGEAVDDPKQVNEFLKGPITPSAEAMKRGPQIPGLGRLAPDLEEIELAALEGGPPGVVGRYPPPGQPPLPLGPLPTPDDPKYVPKLVKWLLGFAVDPLREAEVAVRPSSLLARADAYLRRIEAEAAVGAPGASRLTRSAAWLGRNSIQFVTMRGAMAHGLAKIALGHGSTMVQIDQQRRAARSILQLDPGAKSFASKIDKREKSAGQFFTEELGLTGEFPEKLVSAHRTWHGFDPETGKPATMERLMRHTLTLFNPKLIPDDQIDLYYKLTRDEKRYVIILREMVKQGTKREEALGLKIEKVINQPADPDYFPQRNLSVRMLDLTKTTLKEPPTWAFHRDVDTASQALSQNQKYASPLDAVVDYIGDIQRYRSDLVTVDALKKMKGVAFTMRQLKAQDTLAARLYDLRESIVAKGVVNIDPKEMEFWHSLGKIGLDTEGNIIAGSEVLRDIGRLHEEVLKGSRNARKVKDQVVALHKKARDQKTTAQEISRKTAGINGLLGVNFIDRAVGKQAFEFFGQGSKNFLTIARAANHASAVLRFMQAGFDLSALLIHGMLTAFTHPKEWAAGTGRMLNTVFHNPEVLQEFVKQNLVAIQDLTQHGGVLGIQELAESAEAVGSFLGHMPLVGKFANNLAMRAERGFRTWQDVTRVELWKTFRPLMKDTEELQKLGRWVNGMTGVYNPALAGLPQSQRYLEAIFISFAPMYRRASYGLLTQAFTGGLPRRAMWDSVARLMGVGLMFGAMARWIGGNERSHDWSNPQFLAFPAGDGYIGIGTAFYSLARLLGNITQATIDPKEHGMKMLTTDIDDQPLLRWWRSQAPPLPSALLDLITGENYIGQPLRGDDGDFLETAMVNWSWRQFTPIMMETALSELRGPEDIYTLAEGAGLRTFPESPWSARLHLRNFHLMQDMRPEFVQFRREQVAKDEAITFDKLPQLLRTRLDEAYPDIVEQNELVDADIRERGDTLDKRILEYTGKLDDNRISMNKLRQQAYNIFLEDGSARKFRDSLKQINVAHRELSESLNEERSPRFAGVIEFFKEKRLNRVIDETFVGDFFHDRYMELFHQSGEFEGINGEFLFDKFREADRLFQQTVGSEIYTYIQERRRVRASLPKDIQEFEDAKDALSEYWALSETIWGIGSEEDWLLNEISGRTARAQAEFRRKNPRVRRLERRLDVAQERFRRANPELDWLLTKWYDSTPHTRFAKEQLLEWDASRIRRTLGFAA